MLALTWVKVYGGGEDCPTSFLPQHETAPLRRRPHVKELPAEILYVKRYYAEGMVRRRIENDNDKTTRTCVECLSR